MPTNSPARPSIRLPLSLFDEFRKVVGADSVLGIYHAGERVEGKVLLERTVGRENVVELVDRDVACAGNVSVETAWLPDGGKNPVTMVCQTYCDRLSTRSGKSYHTGRGIGGPNLKRSSATSSSSCHIVSVTELTREHHVKQSRDGWA